MKVLNLYAGIGGNRKLWEDVEVTAVENNLKIAKIYQDFFPNDNIVIGDAHQYLLDHYKEFDFIWSSPPCKSHSRQGKLAISIKQIKPRFPDMKLYEEIIFLQQFAQCLWVVENVKGYYIPLIYPQESGRHYFWANFNIGKIKIRSRCHHTDIENLQKRKGFEIKGMDTGHRKDQVLRNCVEPELGLHVFKCAFKIKQRTLS